MMPGLAEISKKLIERNGKKARFFETGLVYFQKNNQYLEKRKLGISYWQPGKNKDNFIQFKGLVEAFFKSLFVFDLSFRETSSKIFVNFCFEIYKKDKRLGVGGQVQDGIFFVEIDLDSLLGLEGAYQASLWPKFPSIFEDLTFKVLPKTPVGEVILLIKSTSSLIQSVELVDSYKEFHTFRITYQSLKKNLSSKDVEKIRNKIIQAINRKFRARLKQKP
jgi:phenylalanyl-tRNA synthetase beta chain